MTPPPATDEQVVEAATTRVRQDLGVSKTVWENAPLHPINVGARTPLGRVSFTWDDLSVIVEALASAEARATASEARAREVTTEQPIETAPVDERVLVHFTGAGWIVAYRDAARPDVWVRYLGFGKSETWPAIHEDYATHWMRTPAVPTLSTKDQSQC